MHIPAAFFPLSSLYPLSPLTVNRHCPQPEQDLPVYTGYACTSQVPATNKLGVSYGLGAAKDSPEMEAFDGRFKEEGRPLFLKIQTLSALIPVVDERIWYYNQGRRCSSVNHAPLVAFIETNWANGQT